jgi:hypothetical protein
MTLLDETAIRVLGPLEVRHRDEPVNLGIRRLNTLDPEIAGGTINLRKIGVKPAQSFLPLFI